MAYKPSVPDVVFSNQFRKTLAILNTRGQIQFFAIFVQDSALGRDMRSVYRFKQVGFDGKISCDVEVVSYGKNIGKANETTPAQQAEIIANTYYNKALDRGYKEIPFKFWPRKYGICLKRGIIPDGLENAIENLKNAKGTDAQGNLKPMKCHEYEFKKANWPCHIQPKLDGCRCFVRREGNEIIYSSRNGKIFDTLAHINKSLVKFLPEGIILDAEVYLHGKTFQTVVSALKRYQPDITPKLQLHVFDLAMPDVPWNQRYKQLVKLMPPTRDKYVKLVETKTIVNEMEMKEQFSRYIEQGYEGAIIRYWDGLYQFNQRSYRVVKYKEFDEAEFKIKAIEPAKGRDEGTAIFVLKTKDGKIFRARPRGTFEQRANYLENASKLIGKRATVIYQGLTDFGVPRFPSLKTVRDYE